MLSRHTILLVLSLLTAPCVTLAQSDEQSQMNIHLELNTLNDTDAACRLTFVATNGTNAMIDKAVFETVIFDSAGSVVTLSLFDFHELPSGRPRVRQFDVSGIACSSVGRVLINGANTCTADGEQSTLCESGLSLSSRVAAELLG